MSQLDLALEAGVSARHLSYIETGRSRASRETIGRLADALGMPLRERNVLILAGGFAPEFSESPLRTPALDRMREAVELILRHQEPYPAFVVSRHWDVLLANDAAMRMNRFLMQGRPFATQQSAASGFRSSGFQARSGQLDRGGRPLHP